MKDSAQTTVDKQAAWREQARKELLANRDLPITEKFRMVEEMGDVVEAMKSAKNVFVKKTGYTLVELLVVIAGLAVLFLLFGPIPRAPAPDNHARTRMLSNGRGIHQTLFAAHIESLSLVPEGYWPSSESNSAEDSSTGYFRNLMRKGVFQEDFFTFSAPRVPPARHLDEFSAEHNAWSVVTGLHPNTSHSQDPFLISRNLNESALIDWSGDEDRVLENIGHRGAQSQYITPFDEKAVVVIYMGGGGAVLSQRALLWRNLNPNALTNLILNP